LLHISVGLFKFEQCQISANDNQIHLKFIVEILAITVLIQKLGLFGDRHSNVACQSVTKLLCVHVAVVLQLSVKLLRVA